MVDDICCCFPKANLRIENKVVGLKTVLCRLMLVLFSLFSNNFLSRYTGVGSHSKSEKLCPTNFFLMAYTSAVLYQVRVSKSSSYSRIELWAASATSEFGSTFCLSLFLNSNSSVCSLIFFYASSSSSCRLFDSSPNSFIFISRMWFRSFTKRNSDSSCSFSSLSLVLSSLDSLVV